MSDRTPADALARARWDRELDPDHPWHVAWDDVSPRLRQEQVEFAEADIELLAAAGYRVVPMPDDNTRADAHALAVRLRQHAAHREATGNGYTDQRTKDLLAAAALLDGQPQDRPDRCPECDNWSFSDDSEPCPGCGVGGSGDNR